MENAANIDSDIDARVQELGKKITECAPKPVATKTTDPEKSMRNFDMGMAASMIQSTIEGAKGMGKNNLFKLLREKGVLHTRGDLWNVAKYEYIKSGLFTTAYVTRTVGDSQRYHLTTFVTPNGLSFIADIVEKEIASETEKSEAKSNEIENSTENICETLNQLQPKESV